MICLINELHDKLLHEESDATVMAFLGEIYAKISAHFALEEKIMREAKYDQYEDHKTDHEQLLDEIRDIMDDYEDDAYFDDTALAKRLTLWFTEHFGSKDARLHKHLHRP
jgi:hemerythrin